jgi:large subunit ribosomal protein L6
MIIKLFKKNIIKIPKNISIYLCENNILTLIGPLGIKSIKFKTKILFFSNKNSIVITQYPAENSKFFNNKKLKILVNIYNINIKQIINEISHKSKQKLNLVGIGYRARIIKISNILILHFKLGYSHQIYFKIPKYVFIICPKPTKIFIFGSKQQKINQLAALIKSYKIPEPYKGKGIFYDNENVVLKEGKKI